MACTSSVWTCGCGDVSMFALVTHRLPFATSTTATALLRAIKACSMVPCMGVAEHEPAVWALVRCMLSTRAGERPRGCRRCAVQGYWMCLPWWVIGVLWFGCYV